MDDLERVLSRRVLADGNASSVVPDLDGAVGGKPDVDRPGLTGHCLVDRVVDDLPDQVVEAALVGRADVHAGATTDGLEAFEHLDACRRVVRATCLAAPRACRRRCLGRLVGHADPPMRRSYSWPSSSSL